jgi:hypothetical protein
MSYILNFLTEILLILTYVLASTDQAMNDSPFHMLWVVGLGCHGHEEGSQTGHESVPETYLYRSLVHFYSNHTHRVKM